ncbi:hypothetical protein Tco_1502603 [Tanacetum coccineum]
MKCPLHYLTEMQEAILFYNGLEVPTRQILDSKGAIPTKKVVDAKVAIQEMAENSQKWHNRTSRTRSTETSDGLAAIQAQLNNLERDRMGVMKDKIKFNGRNELGNFVNAPVFNGNFYVITDFTIVEDMDPYLDEGMGDVIVGKPFCKASYVEARRFDGIITIRDGNDSVSEQDKMNGISHSYQKLKGFFKGVLNLGPEFIRDAKVEEWLIRGYTSVHEMQ